MSRIASLGLAALVLAAFAPNLRADSDPLEALKAKGFRTLATALEITGLDAALRSQELTVFAPNDKAFAALPKGRLDALTSSEAGRKKLKEILLFHVIAGRRSSAELLAGSPLMTLAESGQRITLESGALRVGEARIIDNDVKLAKSTIHVIDSVLLPPSFSLRQFKANWRTPVRKKKIVGDVVELRASGGGVIIIDEVQALEIRIRTSGGGRVEIRGGLCEVLDVDSSGGSRVELLDLKANRVRVRSSGGSTARVQARGRLDMVASGSGRIDYRDVDGLQITRSKATRYSKIVKLDSHQMASSKPKAVRRSHHRRRAKPAAESDAFRLRLLATIEEYAESAKDLPISELTALLDDKNEKIRQATLKVLEAYAPRARADFPAKKLAAIASDRKDSQRKNALAVLEEFAPRAGRYFPVEAVVAIVERRDDPLRNAALEVLEEFAPRAGERFPAARLMKLLSGAQSSHH